MDKAKQNLETIDVKGKPYVMVNTRVIYFRDNYLDYGIETEWIQIDNEIAICKAMIKDSNGRIISTGTAFEREGSSFINKTSHIENAETSAVGRALGFMNIGIDTSIASAEEVGNAIKNQASDKTKADIDTKKKSDDSTFYNKCKSLAKASRDIYDGNLFEFGDGKIASAKDIPVNDRAKFLKKFEAKDDSELPF